MYLANVTALVPRFEKIYSGTYCASSSAILGGIRSTAAPSALAGGVASALLAMRSARPPHAVLNTAFLVAAISVIIGEFGAGDVVSSAA